MRWFFSVLILANVVAACWFSAAENHRAEQHEKQQALAEKKSGSANTLILLSERSVVDGAVSAVEMEAAPLDLTRQRAEADLPEPEPEPEPVVPALLEAVIPQEQKPACALIGPFVDQSLAAEIQTRVVSLNLEADLLQSEREVSQDYWLIIPPQVTEAEARRWLLELKDKSIDSYLIEDGEYQYGITLGVFSNKSNAEEYHRDISAQGYQAVIKLLPRMANEYWLEMPEPNARALPDELWRDIEQLSGASVTSAKYGFCGEVSPSTTPFSESE